MVYRAAWEPSCNILQSSLAHGRRPTRWCLGAPSLCYCLRRSTGEHCLQTCDLAWRRVPLLKSLCWHFRCICPTAAQLAYTETNSSVVPGCPCPHKSPLSCRSSISGWLLWLVCLHSAACRSAVNLGFCHQTGGLTAVCREASRQACTGLQSGLLRQATPALTSCLTAQKP